MKLPASALAARDRSAIVVDEWGPFDWRSPRLWPVDSSHAMPLRLAVLGPRGRWRLVAERGVANLSSRAGRTGDTISVVPATADDWGLTLEYSGGATTSPRGERRPAGAPVRFRYERFEPALEWSLRFFARKDSSDIAALVRNPPILEQRARRLDFEWYRPLVAGLPRDHWALEATAMLRLDPGEYLLRTISDDGIRVYVDDKLVIDRWSVHESIVDTAPIGAGVHQVRVEYFQEDGWTELRVEVLRVRSPG